MTIHRESGPSYHHTPIVQGGELLLPHGGEQGGGVVEGGYRWPEETPVVITPPIFFSDSQQPLFCVFRVSLLPPFRNAEGGGSLYRCF
jgi:hypothetical protein